MSNLEDDLRGLGELLRSEVSLPVPGSNKVVRRAKIRRTISMMAALMATASVVALGVVAVDQFVETTRPERPMPAGDPSTPSPSLGECEDIPSAHPTSGEEREAADLAREKCEEKAAAEPSPAEGSPAGCLSERNRRNAPPPQDPSKVAYYLSCRGDVKGDDHPVYRFTTSVPEEADVRQRLEVAVRTYLRSPTENQRDRGYLATIPVPLDDVLDDVVMDEGEARLDFNPEIADRMAHGGGSAASLGFVEEITETVLQFDQLEQVRIQIDGDCERFWRLFEMSCHVLTRD